MKANAGDQIVIEAAHVGEAPRKGTILKVVHAPSGVTEFQVRWSDGKETLFIPMVGSARVVPRTAT